MKESFQENFTVSILFCLLLVSMLIEDVQSLFKRKEKE